MQILRGNKSGPKLAHIVSIREISLHGVWPKGKETTFRARRSRESVAVDTDRVPITSKQLRFPSPIILLSFLSVRVARESARGWHLKASAEKTKICIERKRFTESWVELRLRGRGKQAHHCWFCRANVYTHIVGWSKSLISSSLFCFVFCL